MSEDQRRYRHQRRHFERRELTAIAEIAGRAAARSSCFIKTGAAAAGVPMLMSDFHGPRGTAARHWLVDSHPNLVRTVNEQVTYDYLDPANVVEGVKQLAENHSYPFLVAHLNAPSLAYQRLRELAEGNVRLPVLLSVTGQSGLVVERMCDPEAAVARVEPIRRRELIPAGTCAELPMAAAGLILGEVMLATDEDLQRSGLVAAYSLARPLRIDIPADTPWPDLLDQITAPVAQASYGGHTLSVVGAGALGNWALMAVVWDGGVQAHIHDGDTFSESNLSRQPLGVGHVGEPKATTLADQAGQIDPEGSYRGFRRFVRKASDLEPLGDILLAAPDADNVRIDTAAIGWESDRLVATAATGTTAARVVVQEPGRACLRCLTGLTRSPASTLAEGHSCVAAPQPSVVSSNMIAAAVMISETRQVLAGRKSRCLRFFAESRGNKFAKHVTDPVCPHRDLGRQPAAEQVH